MQDLAAEARFQCRCPCAGLAESASLHGSSSVLRPSTPKIRPSSCSRVHDDCGDSGELVWLPQLWGFHLATHVGVRAGARDLRGMHPSCVACRLTKDLVATEAVESRALFLFQLGIAERKGELGKRSQVLPGISCVPRHAVCVGSSSTQPLAAHSSGCRSFGPQRQRVAPSHMRGGAAIGPGHKPDMPCNNAAADGHPNCAQRRIKSDESILFVCLMP